MAHEQALAARVVALVTSVCTVGLAQGVAERFTPTYRTFDPEDMSR